MDKHIFENASGAGDVGLVRGLDVVRVASHQRHLAKLPGSHEFVRGPIAGIEPPHESHLHGDTRFVYRRDGVVGSLQVDRYRLLAERRYAYLGGSEEVIY